MGVPAATPGTAHTFGVSRYVATPAGHRLHAMANGAGTPTVVFESGLGFSRATWGLVQPRVAARTRAVVYDRAGLGRSDPASTPRTLHRLAGDLGTLLDALGAGPFILVGHSWGGPIVRVAAAADRARIRGLVLVDPSDEHADAYFSPAAAWQFAATRALIPALARLGLYRLLGSRPGGVQPADVAADHRAEDFTVVAARATAAELRPFLGDLRALRARPLDLGDLPVTVISGTRMGFLDRAVRAAIVAAHRQTVASLANARFVAAPDSGHLIPFSEPDLIVAEILRLIP